MVVGKDDSALRASLLRVKLPLATFSSLRSNRTLVEASHPSSYGDMRQLLNGDKIRDGSDGGGEG